MVVLPHRMLRTYPDCGDWFLNKDGTPAMVCAADTGNDWSNLAILLHEWIESLWCWQNGVTEAEVNEFDRKWFEDHADSEEEPGYAVNCPYRIGHLIAEKFEREFLMQFGRMWIHHEESVNALYADRKAIDSAA
jgi:hypothetical protein